MASNGQPLAAPSQLQPLPSQSQQPPGQPPPASQSQAAAPTESGNAAAPAASAPGNVLNERTYQEVEYLKRNLGPILVAALAEICIRRPSDPIEYLGHWLLRWRYNEELKRRDVQNALEVVRRKTWESPKDGQQSAIDCPEGVPDPNVPEMFGAGFVPSHPYAAPGFGGPLSQDQLKSVLEPEAVEPTASAAEMQPGAEEEEQTVAGSVAGSAVNSAFEFAPQSAAPVQENQPKRPSLDASGQPKRPSLDASGQPKRPSLDASGQPKRPSLDASGQPKRPSLDASGQQKASSVEASGQPKRPSLDASGQPKRPSQQQGELPKRPSAEAGQPKRPSLQDKRRSSKDKDGEEEEESQAAIPRK